MCSSRCLLSYLCVYNNYSYLLRLTLSVRTYQKTASTYIIPVLLRSPRRIVLYLYFIHFSFLSCRFRVIIPLKGVIIISANVTIELTSRECAALYAAVDSELDCLEEDIASGNIPKRELSDIRASINTCKSILAKLSAADKASSCSFVARKG